MKTEIKPKPDYWADDPDHDIEDWKSEVQNNETRLGYWDWVESIKEEGRWQPVH